MMSSVTNNDSLELIMMNGGLHHEQSFESSNQQHQSISLSTELVHETSSGGSDSMNTSSSQSSSNVTTLELHPNVILGIPEDEDPVQDAQDRPHMCSICHASYKTRTHLRRHMFIHLSSRPFPCPECGKGFNRKEHLNKHLEAVHSGTKHQCPYCDKDISRLDHLKRHIKNMHGALTEKQTDKAAVLKVQLPCGQRQKAQLSFLTPSFPPGTIGQTIITPIPLSATTTGMVSIKQERNLVKNEPVDGSGRGGKGRSDSVEEDNGAPSMTIIPSNVLGPGQGVATLAFQSTPTQKVLVHQRLPSGASLNLATSTNGLAGLANLSLSLGGHMPINTTAGGEKKMLLQIFNCGECTATFTTEKDLTAHARTHKPQPFRCPDCPRAYTRREKLTEHIRCVHQGQKFRCEYCGKDLSRKDHVLRHIRSVHPEVYAGTFAEMADGDIMLDDQGRLVSTSSLALPSASGSGNHSGSGGGRKKGSKPTVSIPSIGDVGVLLRSVCHVCLKVFGTAYHLTRHIESCHNGDVRPFSCTACNKMFKRKDHLTKHMKSHCPSLKQESLRQEESPSSSVHESPSVFVSSSKPAKNSPSSRKHQLSPMESGNDCHLSPPSSSHATSILPNLHTIPTSSSPSSSNDLNSSNLVENSGDGEGIDEKQQHSDQFSLVIDSFMQGNVNVVVVDEEISNFLQQSSTSHLTTTFPCGQCQKEFPARDQLIAHLQEHENEQQHIADISFTDF